MRSTHNTDDGSLFLGQIKPSVGDLILLEGETTPRRVTWVMGSEKKGWFACFKGQGKVPTGPNVGFDLVRE